MSDPDPYSIIKEIKDPEPLLNEKIGKSPNPGPTILKRTEGT